METQRFSIMKGTWAVVRLDPKEAIPTWALDATGFVSITRTDDELSVVCAESIVPDGVQSEPGWAALRIHGPLPFTQVGVLASFASPLAAVGISIVALSTFDTDNILVKVTALSSACESLRAAGHELLR